MKDFERRQGEHALSMASIGRLEELLRVLSAEVNRPKRSWPEHVLPIAHVKRWWFRPGYSRSESPAVGPEYEDAARKLVSSIEDALQVLAGRLDQDWRKRQDGEWATGHDRLNRQTWSLGSVIYRLERQPILRGEVELRRTEPIAPDIPDGVVLYLLTVPGTKDQLTRETHGHWGYHYHYLDRRNRRSDTLLTFDRGSLNALKPTLCWERHAEGQKFKARADVWGTDKRESVYSVCHPDTSRFRLTDFKQPGADAHVVWP